MRKSDRIVINLLVLTILCILELIFVIINPTKESKIHEDTRIAPSGKAFVNNTANEKAHIPIKQLRNLNLNSSCAGYPTLLNFKAHNDYWQEYHNRNISFYIFGAYFDGRPTVVETEPVVRILTMTNFVGKTYEEYPLTYCQLWYEEQSEPFVTPMKEMHKIWNYEWGHDLDFHYAYFISCRVPVEYKQMIPRTVSLVANPCDKATNNVRVTYQPLLPDEKRKEFAVCVKCLDYPDVDISNRIVEFVETLRTLGAEKITMYQQKVHLNTSKVLEYYRDTGYLELHNYHNLEIEKNGWSNVLHDAIPYNDCLYRNMYRYKYVVLLDSDELVMPLGNITNWSDLMSFGESVKTEGCQKFASYCFRCVYFPCYPEKPRNTSDIPEYFYMLEHLQRLKENTNTDWSTKCLYSTDHVIATQNNCSIQWTSNVCRSYFFEAKVAQLNHYREPDIKETLKDQVLDTSLWRIKDKIIERSMEVFKELGFLSKE